MKNIQCRVFKLLLCVMFFLSFPLQSVWAQHSLHHEMYLIFVKNTETGIIPRREIEISIWRVEGKKEETQDTLKKRLDDLSIDELNATYGKAKFIQKTTQEGKVILNDLEEGIYYVRETSAGKEKAVPTLFSIPAKETLIYVKSYLEEAPPPPTNEEPPPLIPGNPPPMGEQPFKKIDEDTHEGLSNATFRVTQKNKEGEFVTVLDKDDKQYYVTSGTDGYFTVKDLSFGTYYLWEVEAPEGYKVLHSPIVFDIGDEKAKNQTIFIKNKKLNPPEIDIPNTGELLFYIMMIGGMVLFGIGYRLVTQKED